MHVYLDNAATTKVSAAVFRAMEPYFTEQYGNPSSLYAFGQKAHEAITEARERIAALLHCEPREITFTPSGTNGLGIGFAAAGGKGDLPWFTEARERIAALLH